MSERSGNLKSRHSEAVRLLDIELGSLKSDLRGLGLVFDASLGSIKSFDQRNVYRVAIPILLDHLKRPYFDNALGVIAWLLCEKVPETQEAWPMLVVAYRAAQQGKGIAIRGDTKIMPFHAKDQLANALVLAFTPQRLPELIKLLKDRSNGESRILLVQALRRRKGAEIDTVLRELIHDPDLITELSAWKRLADGKVIH